MKPEAEKDFQTKRKIRLWSQAKKKNKTINDEVVHTNDYNELGDGKEDEVMLRNEIEDKINDLKSQIIHLNKLSKEKDKTWCEEVMLRNEIEDKIND